MIAFIKRRWFDILVILFCVFFIVAQSEPLLLRPERFDELATIGWCMVPFALCWLMLGVASTLAQHARNATAETEATAEKLKADAGLAEAQMWQVRHDTKRQNEFHKGPRK